jgi:hypothetical protein
MARVSSSLSIRPIVLGLAIGCGILALVNGYLLASAVDTSPIVPGVQSGGSGPQTDVGLTTPLDTKPIGEFRETMRRPLFNATRKPIDRPKAAKTEVGAQSGSVLDMRLVGVVKTSQGPGRALIRLASETNGKWIAEGETFNGGWKLRTVKDRSVVVDADGRSHELALQVVVRRSDDQDDQPDPGTTSR